MNSGRTVLALGVAAIALPLALVYVLVGTAVLEDRTIVDVAVACKTVLVTVVVEASDAVVFCAKTEGASRTASVVTTVVKRILVRCFAR